MKKNAAYWKKRMEAIEDVSHASGLEYARYAEEQFRKAQAAIEKEINMWYARLAYNNDINLSGAKRLLQKNELEEFHWEVWEYIEKGKTLEYTDQWKKALENASAKVHISRLEAMKIQMQQQCEALYENLSGGLDETLKKIYTEGYYHTAYEIQKGTGVGWGFQRLDDRKIDKALRTCWTNDGNTYSDRIWQNKTKLVNELNTALTQSIIRGDDPQKAIRELSKRMEVSKNNAGRLIMTETAAISSMSQRECFRELDVEEFEFVATLDSHTSDICQSMDGRHFKMSDFQIGLNAPPLHCWCRSCTVPYFNDELAEGGQRAARGEDGKTYYVSADMDYASWHEKFVENTLKSDKIELGVGSSSISGNTMRIELGTIDMKGIDNTISDFSSKIRDYDMENAIVIDKNGKVIQFMSSSNHSIDLFDVELEGATILHNHPESNGIVSFGEDDFIFLRSNQNIKSFHCCNAEYDYSVNVIKDMSKVTYNSIYIEAMQSYTAGEDMQHLAFEVLKKKGYVNYERKGKGRTNRKVKKGVD